MTLQPWLCVLPSSPRRRNNLSCQTFAPVCSPHKCSNVAYPQRMTDPTSLGNIAMHLSDDDDLSSGLAPSSLKKPSQMSLLKDYCAILAAADNPTPAGKAASFMSLNGSKVQVEFEIINNRLRRRILEAVTRERHGDEGVRIVSLLLNTGKLDEKQVRHLVSALHRCPAQKNDRRSQKWA